jgi:Domain of unknown function (DUF4145)
LSWLEFTASVIGSLAWPAAIVICVLLFRKRLISLLPLLKVRHQDWEARFDKAETEALQIPPPAVEAPPTPEERRRFEEIARLSPRAAILELRAALDTAIRGLAEQAGLSAAQRGSLTGLIRQLRVEDRIDPATSALLDDLRAIGNRAAHPVEGQEDFSLDEAYRYRDLTERALASIEQSRARLN